LSITTREAVEHRFPRTQLCNYGDGILFDLATSDVDGMDSTNGGLDQTILAFDTYRPLVADPLRVGYAAVFPRSGDRLWDIVETSYGAPTAQPPLLSFFVSIENNGFFINAGGGGDSATGKGGIGGQLGDKLVNSATGVATGTFSITLPAADAFRADGAFIAAMAAMDTPVAARVATPVAFPSIDNDATRNVHRSSFPARWRCREGSGRTRRRSGFPCDRRRNHFRCGRGRQRGNRRRWRRYRRKQAAKCPRHQHAETLFLAAKAGDGGIGLKTGGNGGDVLSFTPDFRLP
jgi:hypothetical protein